MVYRSAVDIVVIGGGLVGCLIARSLSREGLDVLVIERRSEPGREASAAAAGMLAPQMEGADDLLAPDPRAARAMLDLCLAARRRFPGIVDELEAETGWEVGYRDEGTFVVALTAERATRLSRIAGRQVADGLTAEFLNPDEARRREPHLSDQVHGVLWLPDDHQVDNVALVAAAAAAAATAPGVRFECERTAVAIESERGRVTAVRLGRPDGGAERQPTAAVVVAAGAWSGAIDGLPAPLPVRPVKGQMVAADGSGLNLRHTVGGPDAYTVPRADGRVLIGATVERTGFDVHVERSAIERLIGSAAAYIPALAAAPRLEAWAGLRPGTPDDLPILGTDPRLAGVVYATGHFRNGILLAPLTAEIVARLATGAPPEIDLRPFDVTRLRPTEGSVEPQSEN